MIIQDLEERGLIQPPSFLSTNVHYLTIMGSHSYGTANTADGDSDLDIYGFVIPPKDVVFPHLGGEIHGFGRQKKHFEQYQQHHVWDQDALGGKGRMYDLTVFNIVKYFTLLMENNPNIIDSLFTPQECILHSTQVGNMVRENRKMFLHKGCWHKFKGYAYSQMHKMGSTERHGKRKEIREKYGFDLKFGLHCVRLLYEAEMILAEGDLDLRRHNEHLKSIRRGDVKEEEIRKWASEKEQQLEKLYVESKLPWGPDESKVKKLLLNCLEAHYGDLSKVVVIPDRFEVALRQVKEIIDKWV